MRLDPYDPIYTIGAVARLLQLHEQTLRQYERLGLISPCRSMGRTRLYCQADVERLETITYLVRVRGVNLAGVQILVELSQGDPQVARRLSQRNFSASGESNPGGPSTPPPEEARVPSKNSPPFP